ncbi:MAG TPA: hypothetical protein VE031_08340 [Chthoniobacterales bacterium]|nr:hypothetical protein [Chthoniobacterales bacterium]
MITPLLRELWGPPGLILLAALLGAGGVFWADLQKNAAEKQVREKSDKIAALNEQIAGLVTGGDSFCYFVITSIDPSNTGRLLAINHGKFPLYEVAARIVDLQKFEAKKDNLTLQNLFADDINVQVGSIAADLAGLQGSFPLGEGDRHDYNIFFSARNGLSTQLLRLRKINGV